jgi:hypothetical protein
VAHFVAEVFGGDKLYSEGDGGSHARMIGKHIGKMLTEPMPKWGWGETGGPYNPDPK